MKTIVSIIIILSISQKGKAYEIICPKIPYTAISIEIIPKVSFNEKTSLYKYEYTFKNHSISKLPIGYIRMETFENVLSAKALRYWHLRYQDSFSGILWSGMPGVDSYIIPGTELSGFEFESPNPPGLIKYSVGGWKSINDRNNFPRIVFAEGEADKYAEDEIEPDCPGETYEHRMPEIIGITIGPIPKDTIVAKLRLKRLTDKKWQGHTENQNPSLEISPLDTGKVQLMLFDDKDIDVSKIDLTSIKFGPGKALPTKTEFKKYVDGEKDHDLEEHLKKYNKNHLLMEFNIEDIKVECDIDRVLFLSAKMGDKKLTGAVRIKHALCSDVYKIKAEKEKKEKKPKSNKDDLY